MSHFRPELTIKASKEVVLVHRRAKPSTSIHGIDMLSTVVHSTREFAKQHEPAAEQTHSENQPEHLRHFEEITHAWTVIAAEISPHIKRSKVIMVKCWQQYLHIQSCWVSRSVGP